MGLSLEFLIGNEKSIVKASKKLDFDMFDEDDCIVRKADFSLHIEPRDLNSLSMVASKFNNEEGLTLREYFDLVIDKRDHGLLKVKNEWVEYFSKVNVSQVHDLADAWYKEMQNQYKDEIIELSDAGIQAVNDLVLLCKEAIKDGKTVYHLWYL